MMVLTTICAAASRGARPAVRLSARHVSMMSQMQRSGPNVDAAAAALGESSSSSDGADASTSQPKLSERFAFLPDGVVQVYGRKLMLSPTHITTFRQCPRLYELRHIERLPEPPTEPLVAGILVHEALEQLYKYVPAADRTLPKLQELFRDAWRKVRLTRYRELFFPESAEGDAADGDAGGATRSEADVARERAWGQAALGKMANYFTLEDPTEVTPESVEQWVGASLGGGLEVRGKIDRLEVVDSDGGLAIVDYKTGNAPSQKYSAAANAKIRRDAFFQLYVYALLLREGANDGAGSRDVRELRLLYLGDATPVTEPVDPERVDATAAEVRDVWDRLVAAIKEETFEPTAGPLCKFCAHRDGCPAYLP